MLTILSEISNLKLFISFHPQSGECHRAPRGQHGPRRTLAPSTHHRHYHLYPLPDPNHVQFGVPPFLPTSSGFCKPHSLSLYAPPFEIVIQPSSIIVTIPGLILTLSSDPSPQRNCPARTPPRVKANIIPGPITAQLLPKLKIPLIILDDSRK